MSENGVSLLRSTELSLLVGGGLKIGIVIPVPSDAWAERFRGLSGMPAAKKSYCRVFYHPTKDSRQKEIENLLPKKERSHCVAVRPEMSSSHAFERSLIIFALSWQQNPLNRGR